MWRCVTIPLRRCHGACGPDLAFVRAQRHATRQLAGILHANPAAHVTRPSRGRTKSVWTRSHHRHSVKVMKQDQSAAISRKLILLVFIPCVIVTLLAGWRWVVKLRCERARADWKSTTLPLLAELTRTNQEVIQELDSLKAGGGVLGHRDWIGDHVLLMTNGEYLAYAFRHGFNSGLTDHLLLAHGSDDHWYYSTYHFCNSMVAIMADEPPGSIAEFAHRYSAREFDGKSDECLQHTWP